MTSWQQLHDEISLWQQPITFWWRDDDAIENTNALQTMLSMADDYQIPVHLAVIPNHLHSSLSLIKTPAFKKNCYVLQHGVEHKSYALPEQRKIELGGSQDTDTLLQNLSAGRNHLMLHFNQQYLDILVPPWNRIDDRITEHLPAIGYKKLSILGGRKVVETDFHYNVHIDIINWKERKFAGEDAVITKIIEHLQDKRLGTLTSTNPCGLMTHHLDHDPACWAFLTTFFSFCQQYSNIQWISGESLLRS